MDPKAYWVGFNLVKGIGAVRLKALLDHFGNLEIAWGAPADALLAAGLSSRIVENLTILRKQVDLEQVMERIQRQDIRVITWDDTIYPRRLREIDQPPPVLYLRGLD
jgi:DNA processing protein